MTTDPTGLASSHTHATTTIDQAIAALDARLQKLESGGVIVVPPPPPGRPFAAPVITSTVQLPPSLDITGATEQSGPLNAFIAKVPDHTMIDFGAAKILLAAGVQFAKRTALYFQGNQRASLIMAAAATPGDYFSSPFCLGRDPITGIWGNGNSDIVLDGFALVGNSPHPGVYGGGEGQHSLCLTGTTRLEVKNMTGAKAFGDVVFVNLLVDAWVHGVHGIDAGRNGVSIISGQRVTIEDSAFDTSGYCVLDVEPNVPADAIASIMMRRIAAKSYGIAEYFALDGSNAGAPIADVTVDSCTLSGRALSAIIGYSGPSVNRARAKRIAFTNNASPLAGGSIHAYHVDGITAGVANKGAGVTIPLSTTDCTVVA